MTDFEDVYKNAQDIEKGYKRLKDLLISKLVKYQVQLTSEETFQELIHKVADITTNEYDIEGNFEPSDIYMDISNSNILQFNINLFNRTMYYIRWLRYYLAKKGVDLQLLNNAYSLGDHIRLIDFMDIIKNTTLEVTLTHDTLYYGNNYFSISITDDDGMQVTSGEIIIYKDGLRSIIPYQDTYVINVQDLNEHNYIFQYRGGEHYHPSNIVEFTKTAQPMPVTFTAILYNTEEREYIIQDDSLKGYVDDDWTIKYSLVDVNNMMVFLPAIAKIYDNDPNRQIELENGYETKYFKILKHNNENNGNPIKVTIEAEENEYYDFNTNLIEFYVNILYPYHKIIPSYDYTSKESYEFTINFCDENTGELSSYFNNKNINLIFKDDENNVLINTSSIINNSVATIQYNDNLKISDYFLDWEISELSISKTDIINILANIRIENDYIYASDEPQIQLLNNFNVEDIIIKIRNIYNDNVDDYFPLEIDENNYLILPDEYKQVGTYILRYENYTTQEEYEFTYTIAAPYSYYSDKIYDRQEFYITIYDTEDFDANNITDYIKIFEYTQELEYQYEIDNNHLVVIADVSQNPDFKGINKFWININNYEKTKEFQLLSIEEIIKEIDEETGEEIEEIIYGGNYEIVSDIEIGINEVDIACYKWDVQHIDVAVTHNGTTTNYSIDSENEDFVFTHNFETSGEYTITVTDEEETVTFNITLSKNILKTQEFKFKDRIGENETPSMLNSLGFGFDTGNKINENLTIVFYYDNPSNILTTKVINTQDTQYHIYTDIYLASQNIPDGYHTIYAYYDGSSDYYDPFLISKEFCHTEPTSIVYDGEFTTIDIGETIQMSLLTLDSQHNIVTEGHYEYNGEEYDLDEDVTITAPIVTQSYPVTINYVADGIYEDSSILITFAINGDIYDYYASSLTGNNTNNGLYPSTAVADANTLFSISQPEDLLCLMEGEYTKQTINRNAKIYGYHKHDMQNIKLNAVYIAPNTTLELKNVMLNTGNGYAAIVGVQQFVNSSNQTVELSTIPGQTITPVPEEDVYTINTNDSIHRQENMTITGTTMKNGVAIGNKLVKLYEGNNLTQATMSDANGDFAFNITNNDIITSVTVKITNCEKIVRIMTDYVVTNLSELQTALTYVQSGETINIRNGTYILDKRYDIPSCTIIGESNTDTIIKNYGIAFTSGTDDIEVSNIKFDGNNSNRGDYGTIYLGTQVNSNIHDCHFTNMTGPWNSMSIRIATTNPDKNIEIYNNLFDGTNYVDGFGHTNASIAVWHLSTAYNVKIHNNTFNHSGSGGDPLYNARAIAFFNNRNSCTLNNCEAYCNTYSGTDDINHGIIESTCITFPLDGTDELYNKRSANYTSDGELTVVKSGECWLTDYYLNNSEMWKLSYECYYTGNNWKTSLIVITDTSRAIDLISYPSTSTYNQWIKVNATKINSTQVQITVDDVTTKTVTVGSWTGFYFGVFSWQNSQVKIRNINFNPATPND